MTQDDDNIVIIIGDPHLGRHDPFKHRMPNIVAYEIGDVAPMRDPIRLVLDRLPKDWEKGRKRRMKPRKR